jgi:predicted alpha/beta-fold hydrolase
MNITTPAAASSTVQLFGSEFRDRAPWWGGDLQTMRNQLVPSALPENAQAERLEFVTLDGSGDRLVGMLETPAAACASPLIVLIHGLTGDQDSSYMLNTARLHLQQSRKVLRLNLRGAGPSRLTAKGYYYGGCVDDIRAVLEGLPAELCRNGIFAIGYSLGGNILINTLANRWVAKHLVGAATVSAPLRPAEAASRLMEPRNRLYHNSLLRRMKTETLSPHSHLDPAEKSAVQNAQTIYDFDDCFTAPRNGYRNAPDYYSQTSGARFVHELAVPTLLIHARNDPWIPVAPYDECKSASTPNALIVITESGGHVGFHEKGFALTRHDRAIEAFLSQSLNNGVFA